VLLIEGESYQMHEAKQRADKQKRTRTKKPNPPGTKTGGSKS